MPFDLERRLKSRGHEGAPVASCAGTPRLVGRLRMKVGQTIDCLIDECGGPTVDMLVAGVDGMTLADDRERIALCESLKVRRSSMGWLRIVLKTSLPG